MSDIKMEIARLYYLVRHELGFYKGTLRFFLFKTIAVVIPVVVTLLTWKYGVVWLVVYLIALLMCRREEYSPKHMQVSKDGYAGRKALLASAIFELGNCVNFASVDKERLRAHALDMIVSYVRGFRSDVDKTKIFSCLLIRNEKIRKISVLMRDTDSSRKRRINISYDCDGMLAEKCFILKDVQVTGDVKKDYPNTQTGKEYNSILCVPIYRRDPNQGVAAVVSIDSTERYHFDTRSCELYTNIMPYIALISVTFWD